MKQPSRTRALRRVGLSSAVAITVLASGVGVAGASNHTSKPSTSSAAHDAKDVAADPSPPMPFGGPHGIGGDITALTSSSVTIERLDGTTTTYAINGSTTVTDLRHGAATSTLALGENVHVIASTTDPSVASSIDIVPAVAAGRVSAVNGDSITITGPKGTTETVVVSAATNYSKKGASATLSDASVGSYIFALGTFGSTSSTLDAATIGIGTPTPGNGPVHGDGPGPPGVAPFGDVPPGTQPQTGPHVKGAANKVRSLDH